MNFKTITVVALLAIAAAIFVFAMNRVNNDSRSPESGQQVQPQFAQPEGLNTKNPAPDPVVPDTSIARPGLDQSPESELLQANPPRTTIGIVEKEVQGYAEVVDAKDFPAVPPNRLDEAQIEAIRTSAIANAQATTTTMPAGFEPETGDGPLGQSPLVNDLSLPGPADISQADSGIPVGGPAEPPGPGEGSFGPDGAISDSAHLPGPGQGTFDPQADGPDSGNGDQPPHR